MALEFIRQIDKLGRIVIPKDLRKHYDFKANDKIYLTAYVDGILIHNEEYVYKYDEKNNKKD